MDDGQALGIHYAVRAISGYGMAYSSPAAKDRGCAFSFEDLGGVGFLIAVGGGFLL